MSYFNALSTIIEKYNDPQANYFAIYALLNLINSIDIKKDIIKEPPVTKTDPLLSHTLAEIDY